MWKLRGGVKVQKRIGSAGVAKNAIQERIKTVYPLLMRNENRFLEVFFLKKKNYLSMYQSVLASRDRKL